ncbi:MAG: 3-oxoacyl-ACP synthase III family protein, partial [Oscillospiraceae bacterium]
MRQRHVSSLPTWYMGVEAARQAVENAGLQPQDLDVILCTSVTSEYVTPSMSCVIQAKLGAGKAFCMDVNAACSGLVFALDLASRYLRDDAIQNVLVVSAESLSSITDYDDRPACCLATAGACVVRRGEGVFASHLVSDGRGGGLLFARNPEPSHRFRNGQTSELYDDGFAATHGRYLYMNGREVYKFAIQAMPEAVQGACKKAGVPVSQLDWIVPHQANQRIVDTAASRLGVSADRMYGNLARFGNTSSASIPLCLY